MHSHRPILDEPEFIVLLVAVVASLIIVPIILWNENPQAFEQFFG